MLARLALQKLISDFDFKTVLDIGSGQGLHARVFADAGKAVTAIDLGKSIYYGQRAENYDNILVQAVDFYSIDTTVQYDCIWASHVLEHQRNPGFFLEKCFQLCKNVFAVTVPPLKHDIVGGHVTLWNPGLLLYNMILAGFDCRDAIVKCYDYNISVIVEKKKVPSRILESLHYDYGDIMRLKEYFPFDVQEGFPGNEIMEWYWST
jgi:SAM-dependent methyltransferase